MIVAMTRKSLILIGTLTIAIVLLLSEMSAWAKPIPLWSWPLKPRPAIAQGFAPPQHNWLPGHRGVDLVAHDGQQVFASAKGAVSFAQTLAGRGVVVVIHGELRTTYEPVQSKVTLGQVVRQGQLIGTMHAGDSHCSPNGHVQCLHWGLLRDSQYLNPLSQVPMNVRLLPLFQQKVNAESTPLDAPARRQHEDVPWTHGYTTELLPNWHGQGSLGLLEYRHHPLKDEWQPSDAIRVVQDLANRTNFVAPRAPSSEQLVGQFVCHVRREKRLFRCLQRRAVALHHQGTD